MRTVILAAKYRKRVIWVAGAAAIFVLSWTTYSGAFAQTSGPPRTAIGDSEVAANSTACPD
ncbi:MAG: hypothetical protein ACR2NN_09745 [Bryobacteraceae bacterium]